MKVNVEVTCTPEEARLFFGLPDIKPMQDRIMGEIEERLRSSLGAMNPETVFKTWLRDYMKGRAKDLGLKNVRINSAACLDRCELGPTVVIYPEGVWYSCATKEDIDEVLQTHLVKGD